MKENHTRPLEHTGWRRLLPWLGLAAVSLVLGVAGAFKALAPAAFHETLLGYRILGGWAAVVVALALPWLEIILAAALWWPPARRMAWWLSGILLLVFTAALLSALWRGLAVDCGCFGADSTSGGGTELALLRDLVLLVCWWLARSLTVSPTEGAGKTAPRILP